MCSQTQKRHAKHKANSTTLLQKFTGINLFFMFSNVFLSEKPVFSWYNWKISSASRKSLRDDGWHGAFCLSSGGCKTSSGLFFLQKQPMIGAEFPCKQLMWTHMSWWNYDICKISPVSSGSFNFQQFSPSFGSFGRLCFRYIDGNLQRWLRYSTDIHYINQRLGKVVNVGGEQPILNNIP